MANDLICPNCLACPLAECPLGEAQEGEAPSEGWKCANCGFTATGDRLEFAYQVARTTLQAKLLIVEDGLKKIRG